MVLCAFDELVYRRIAGRACVQGDCWAEGLHLVDWRTDALVHWAVELERWRPCKAHKQCSVRAWKVWMGYFAVYADSNAPEVAWVRARRAA